MAIARKKIARDPKHFHGYNELALALTQRARETADPVFYQQADEAVRTSLSLSPDNFEAMKVRTWSLLGQHRFAEALDARHRAQHEGARRPDGLRHAHRCEHRARQVRRCREVGAVDARPAPGQHPGADARGLPARALRRHRGRDRADAVGIQPHAVPGDRGPRVGAHPDRAPGADARGRPRLRSGRSTRRSSSSRTTTTPWARWPRCARRRHGIARRRSCSSSATRRRRIPKTCSSWPKRRHERD